ncbi:hypothetical protein FSP39_011237 [Pinctada imbricata]|uniref:Cell morphogenesis protein N-terminal domain-containing protein n=1 Tax=Pinctada imbricata TaxID=66713 RepID=A0AA88Y816_PINIB|nr:hypothetical protein FSP39_011237 [Pinctada imbricata]
MDRKDMNDAGPSPMIRFPWRRDLSRVMSEDGAKPGEYILQSLFLEFCATAERKVELVIAEPLEKPLAKSLQRGEDAQLDQLLNAFGTLSEQCLPSILKSLFRWFERQNLSEGCTQPDRHRHRSKGIQTNPNSANISIIADLYAEVIGVMVQSRFQAVRKHFMSELKELKSRDQTPYIAQSIISLLTGLKYFRVKVISVVTTDGESNYLIISNYLSTMCVNWEYLKGISLHQVKIVKKL